MARTMSVPDIAGLTVFTVTPLLASSCARALEVAIPALAAE